MNANQTVINDFINKHPFAAAQTLNKSDSKEVAVLLQGFNLEKNIKLLGLMNPKKAADCFALLPLPKIKELLQGGDSLFMASLLKLIDEPVRSTFLSQISQNKAAAIERKLEHDPKSVGAFMERAVVTSKDMTVKDAIAIIDSHEASDEFYLHIINVQGVFEGIVRCKDLLLAEKDTKLNDIMNSKVSRFTAETPVEHILNDEAWDEFHYIPVIDKSEKLLGTLPYNFSLKMKMKLGGSMTNEIFKTGSALGELYRIGLTGLINTPGK
jgi:magnesium transporter